MEDLPIELVEEILCSNKLSIEDILNFSATCSHFRALVVNSKVVWKNKFIQNWPRFIYLLDNSFMGWYQEVKYIHDLRRESRMILSTMSPRFYKKHELSDTDLVEWSDLCKQHSRTYEYLAQDLTNIIRTSLPIMTMNVVPLLTPGNKTMQYYTMKVLRYLRQERLSKEWNEFLALPTEQHILEKGAVLVAQWCQPHVEIKWADIASQLDDIANRVKGYLKLIGNPDHPIFSVPAEELNRWRVANLSTNQFNAFHCKQIIAAMGVILYQQLRFTGNNTAYYMPENSFINEVLERKTGIPISLAVVYESVARRLGLRCEPVNLPAHFLLRFTEGINQDDPFADSYYIDVFNNGDIIRRSTCPHSQGNTLKKKYPCATVQQVVERMANNLEVSARNHSDPIGRITRLRSNLELQQLVNPTDITTRASLGRLYMLRNMDTKPLISLLLSQEFEEPLQVQRLIQMLQDYEARHKKTYEEVTNKVEAAQRSPNLKFAVGMVMRHLNLDYCCVIYDWDPTCLADPDWQIEMNVHKLALKDQQPFYNVLVEDGSLRYVAQENMEPTRNTGFLSLNEDIGRHFSHFYRTHYVPNAEKEKEYPADSAVRQCNHHMLLGNAK